MKLHQFKSISAAILVLSLCFNSITAQSLGDRLTKLFSESYKENETGATVMVAKEGKIIYKNAFGLANLELNVPMQADNVFEIGSITKQFTAVAILMLQEQGKLDINDPITKFIPDYPTHGKTITIHHLLNHTSGIKSYTSMNLQEIARTDMTPKELIDFFKNEPMDFDPGEQWSYNNSGYILLGYIIEKSSGMSYEDFIETKIFKPLGMENSRYGHKLEIIKNRAYGYQKSDNYRNAEYLSMTLPYAAGSLMSTVEDLQKWQLGLTQNKLIKKETLALAHQNTTLNNNKPTYYGYGWSVNEIQGIPTVEHGGGIFGYTSYQIYVPSKDLQIAVLTNCNCNSPTDITIEAAAIALGKPYSSTEKISLKEEQLKEYVGLYRFEDGAERAIGFENGTLYSQRDGGKKFIILPKSVSTFYYEDSFSEIIFNKSPKGINATFKNRINATEGQRVSKELPKEKKAIKVDAEILKRYTGTYEIQPGFDMVITLKDGQLISQATGQPSFIIHPESETKFFVKEFPAAVEFVVANGVVDKAILFQGGRQTTMVRKN